MRRILAIASMLGALVVPLAPAPPAGAVTAGACTWTGGESYQPFLAPVVGAPQGFGVHMAIGLNCFTHNTSISGVSSGTGAGTGSCAAELGSATLSGPNWVGIATWVRAGTVGWMILTFQAPGPQSTYGMEGPFVWVPQGDCALQGITSASLQGAGPVIGS